ncbi:hypothetical protein Tco_1055056 [Tanacetum coccineum]|uniref:Uncharacterized protein n=1 Tax=Tanacetum coccineum TaxID=301880 RepID=A0ABQ5GZM1_9ASTR
MEVILLVMTRKRWNVSIVISWDILLESAEILGVKRTGNRSQDSSRRTVNVEESSSKAMLAIDGTWIDWSYMADEEASTNFALMLFRLSEVISVNTVKGKRMTSAVREQGINTVKPTAYWEWRPKSNDPPLSKGYTLGSREDNLKLIELMDLWAKLIDKVNILENALKQSKESHAQTLTMLMKKVKRLEDKLNLVQERFKDHPLKGHDLDLWGDLRMIFDPNEEDDIWLNQQYWELLRWKLHEYRGVQSFFLDGTSIQINMLVEKKYPLKKEILEKMTNLKIEAEEDSNMAIELIKFIKSQIAEQS